MTRASRQAFGMAANTVAVKAMYGVVHQRDYINLAEMLLTHAGADAVARAATLAFMQDSRRDMRDAGRALQNFVLEWDGNIDTRRPGEVLAEIEREAEPAATQTQGDFQ